MKRVAVFGGRDYPHPNRVRVAMSRLLDRFGPFVLVHGGCPTGVDAEAAAWAREVRAVLGLPMVLEPHPADWRRHGRAAGPIRNGEMARRWLHGAVGFPGGPGTADMARKLAAAEVPIWWPDGAPDR